MIFDKDKHTDLFNQWCFSGTTDAQRSIIYKELYTPLHNMAEATLRSKFSNQYLDSDEQDIIQDCIDDLLVKVIGHYKDKGYNAFSYIYSFIYKHFIHKFYVQPNLNKNSVENAYKVRDDEQGEYIYRNLTSVDDQDPIEAVIEHLSDLIDDIRQDIHNRVKSRNNNNKQRLKLLYYLTYCHEYIDKYKHFDITAINEYVVNTYNWSVSEVVVKSRALWGKDSNFTQIDIVNHIGLDYIDFEFDDYTPNISRGRIGHIRTLHRKTKDIN